MTERHILFTPDNIRRIVAKEKWQTRRTIAPQPERWHTVRRKPFTRDDQPGIWSPLSDNSENRKCPFGLVGDRLYIKEGIVINASIPQLVGYRLDGCKVTEHWGKHLTAMFMPKWAARYWLEITEIRVERVQDISHEDAIAEGCKGYNWVSSSPYIAGPHTDDGQLPQEEFQELWDSINKKKHPWSQNPFVWVISFRFLEGKI